MELTIIGVGIILAIMVGMCGVIMKTTIKEHTDIRANLDEISHDIAIITTNVTKILNSTSPPQRQRSVENEFIDRLEEIFLEQVCGQTHFYQRWDGKNYELKFKIPFGKNHQYVGREPGRY